MSWLNLKRKQTKQMTDRAMATMRARKISVSLPKVGFVEIDRTITNERDLTRDKDKHND